MFRILSVVALSVGMVFADPSAWDRVAITWPKFSGLPVTEAAAVKSSWTKYSVEPCVTRYNYQNDTSTFVLFEKQKGLFAGIQVGTANANQNGGVFGVDANGVWNKEITPSGSPLYTITAYTRDPTTLCSIDQKPNKIGTGLWFQHGPYSEKSFHQVPNREVDNVTPNSNFQRGKCFYTMGAHYWNSFSSSMPCDSIYPIFLLYNGGKLNSFGWALVDLPQEQGKRWEHPSGSQLDLFINSSRRPTCLFEKERVLSTQHIFFTQAAFDFC